jgi:hypothetical protein
MRFAALVQLLIQEYWVRDPGKYPQAIFYTGYSSSSISVTEGMTCAMHENPLFAARQLFAECMSCQGHLR